MYLGMLDGDWTSLLPASTLSRSNQKYHPLAQKSCLQQRQGYDVSDCSYSATLLRISCLDILLLDLHGKLRVFLCHQRRKNKNIVPPVTQKCHAMLGHSRVSLLLLFPAHSVQRYLCFHSPASRGSHPRTHLGKWSKLVTTSPIHCQNTEQQQNQPTN